MSLWGKSVLLLIILCLLVNLGHAWGAVERRAREDSKVALVAFSGVLRQHRALWPARAH